MRDESRVRGWLVRFVRRGQEYAKRFSDSTHGGKHKALEKAQAFRDRLLRLLPVRSSTQTAKARGKSGVVGVEERRHNDSVTHFRATWFERGHRRTESFSVNTYGYSKARRLAIDRRRAAVAIILAPRGPLPVKRRRANRSPGVHRADELMPSGNRYRSYRTTWYDASGRAHARSFSIFKYGLKRARALAVKARRNGLRQRRTAHF